MIRNQAQDSDRTLEPLTRKRMEASPRFKAALLCLLLSFSTGAHADKRVYKHTYRFTPPAQEDVFPFDFTPDAATIHLQLGDRVIFRKPESPSTLTFNHTCFKAGDSFLFIPLSPDQNVTKGEPFGLNVTFKFKLKLKAETVLEIVPPMTYVTIADGTLAATTSRYDSAKYTEFKNRKPCEAGFEHRGVKATPASQTDVTVIVCRSGVGGDDAECK